MLIKLSYKKWLSYFATTILLLTWRWLPLENSSSGVSRTLWHAAQILVLFASSSINRFYILWFLLFVYQIEDIEGKYFKIKGTVYSHRMDLLNRKANSRWKWTWGCIYLFIFPDKKRYQKALFPDLYHLWGGSKSLFHSILTEDVLSRLDYILPLSFLLLSLQLWALGIRCRKTN